MRASTRHILIIGLHFPESKSSAAGSRMMQLIAVFQKNNWVITFASPAQKTNYSENLVEWGIEIKKIKPNDSGVDEILKEINPNVVLFDRFMIEEQFGWRISQACPEAIKILDTEDLHFLRKARRQAYKEDRDFSDDDLFSETAKRELASILRCDLTLIISEVERDLLVEKFNISKDLLFYIPFLLDKTAPQKSLGFPTYNQRCNFMFVGNFWHPPNYDAVLWLKTEIWPLIRQQIPEARLHIYGAYTSQKLRQLEKKEEGFIVKGRAVDLSKIFQKHRILLAPLRFGAGLKGKFVEAMLNGTPSITTEIGAEGISGNYSFGGKVANYPKRIADLAVELYQNQKEWEKAQKDGFALIWTRFRKILFEQRLDNRIKDLEKNLKTHRQKNFVGQILQHHRQQSTKYLSRWIEEKNRK